MPVRVHIAACTVKDNVQCIMHNEERSRRNCPPGRSVPQEGAKMKKIGIWVVMAVLMACMGLAAAEEEPWDEPGDNGFFAGVDGEWDFYVAPGSTVDLKITAACEEGELHYQWYSSTSSRLDNPTLLEGETYEMLSVYVDAQQPFYYCEVWDDYGHTSGPISFRINITNITLTAKGETTLSLAPGETAQLEVEASCVSGTLTFEWKKGGTRIEGANGTTLTTDPADGTAYYSCTARDEYGGSEGVTFTIHVENGLTARATCEQDQAVTWNNGTSLGVYASCTTGSVHYQWYSKKTGTAWTELGGETRAQLNTSAVTENTVYTYKCEITDDYDNKKTIEFRITPDNQLRVAPNTGGSSASSTWVAAPNASLKLEAHATCALGEVYYSSWAYRSAGETADTVIPGENKYYCQTAPITDECYYTVTVTDDYGNTASYSFHIRVENHLTAAATGESTVAMTAGDSLSLAVTASCDSGSLHYEWTYYSGDSRVVETVGTNSTLTGTGKAGSYRCVVTDDYRNSKEVWFTTTVENHLTTYAAGDGKTELWILPGETVTLTAGGTCDRGGIHYQWFDQPDTPFGWIMEGETAETLITPPVTVGYGIKYYCSVSDDYGNAARVTFTIRLKNTGATSATFTLKPGTGSGSNTTISYTAGMTVAGSLELAGDGQFYRDEENVICLRMPQCPESFTAPNEYAEFDQWQLNFGGKYDSLFSTGEGRWLDSAYNSYTLTAIWRNPYRYTVENGEATITGYDGRKAVLTVPETLDGYPVTGIAAGAFAECTGLQTIRYAAGMSCPDDAEDERIQMIGGILGAEGNYIANQEYYKFSVLTDVDVTYIYLYDGEEQLIERDGDYGRAYSLEGQRKNWSLWYKDGEYGKEYTVKAAIEQGVMTDSRQVTVWQDDPEDTSWADLEAQMNAEGSEIRIMLQGDVTAKTDSGRILIPEGKTVTIDLNGYTIDRRLKNMGSKTDGYVFQVNAGTTLIITDSSADGTGRITGENAASSSWQKGCICSSGTVILNGGTIGGNSNGAIVNDGGTFIMNGGKITGSPGPSSANAAVANRNGGSFEMNGGSISDNGGNGVSNYQAEFTMNGGEICRNRLNGVSNEATMVMTGGSVCGNGTGNNGGGISISNTASLTMSGGHISGNHGLAAVDVHGAGSVFTMTGGEIVDNPARGVEVQGTFSVAGKVKITGNRQTESNGGYDWDVRLSGDAVIHMAGELDRRSQIGVTTDPFSTYYANYTPTGTNHVVFTEEFLDGNGTPRGFSTSFIPNRPYVTVMKDGELALASTAGFVMEEADFTLPDGTKEIGPEAFTGVKAQVVRIPNGTVSIGNRAFAECGQLRQIRIPASVTAIGAEQFDPRKPVVIFGSRNSAAYRYACERDNCVFVEAQ